MEKKIMNQDVKESLEESKKIAIFSHDNIDGDGVGSMLGIGTLLKRLGKKVYYFTPKQHTKELDFVSGIKEIKTEFDYGDYDSLLFVDFGGYNRISKFTKNNEEYFNNKKLIIIDHHLGALPKAAKYIIRDSSAVSCCEIVFEQTYQWRPELFDKKIANYFYLGIVSDSGNFMYDSGKESIRIMKAGIQLLEMGADKKIIIDNLFYRQTLDNLKFNEVLISRIKLKHNILYTYYDMNEIKKSGPDYEEIKGSFISTMTKINGPVLHILISKRDDKFKCSLRIGTIKGNMGYHDVSCAKICEVLFGGGGHKAAAGFELPLEKDFEKQKENIVDKIAKYIKENNSN